jgi:hypothetical protein
MSTCSSLTRSGCGGLSGHSSRSRRGRGCDLYRCWTQRDAIFPHFDLTIPRSAHRLMSHVSSSQPVIPSLSLPLNPRILSIPGSLLPSISFFPGRFRTSNIWLRIERVVIHETPQLTIPPQCMRLADIRIPPPILLSPPARIHRCAFETPRRVFSGMAWRTGCQCGVCGCGAGSGAGAERGRS